MKLGAEPKKTAFLAVLVLVILIVGYYQFFGGDSEPSAPRPVAAAPGPVVAPPVTRFKPAKTEARRTTARTAVGDWKPRLGSKNPEDRPDPATVDPTLHLNLLAKIQGVEAPPPGRNLFVFGAAPLPPGPKIDLPKVAKIPVNQQPSPPPPIMPSGPPPPPQAPAMAFKYYGYKVSKSDGHKAAFLLDGDDILIAGENDTFKHRYRVVKIGVSSIVIEDTQFKSTQTLPLQENAAG
ncbi:MAG: hypothetical protein M3N54_02595 [Acidobacteriota bacterium]|nr:hypothetical protein [Acidobacteriota bacterium]